MAAADEVRYEKLQQVESLFPLGDGSLGTMLNSAFTGEHVGAVTGAQQLVRLDLPVSEPLIWLDGASHRIGHQLVADDAPEFTQIAPDVLDGSCPELLQDLLELRGLGVLNIRQMFGDTAVKKNKYLRLIVHLTRPMTEPNPHGYERLTGDSGTRHVLDLDVPLITLPVMPGRNLAVLTEAATRLHILRTKGIDPAAMFIARHSNLLERSTP